MFTSNPTQFSHSPPYNINTRDYQHIQTWLQKSKQNYQEIPKYNQQIQYHPINYLIVFKQIRVDDQFINLYGRQINAIARNGMCILAGIYDENEKIYIAKPYEMKKISCYCDVLARVISSTDDIVLGFYILDERIRGEKGNRNDNNGYISIKKYSLIIHFQFMSNDGQVFQLGQLKYHLHFSNIFKLTKTDIEIIKIGQKIKVGFISIQIDIPQKLDLSYFVPPNCIIDQTFLIPPCRCLNLINKTTPITLLPAYQIILQQISLKITNYDKLLNFLKRCTPYFTQHHHDNISLQIQQISLNIGYHNSWMMMNNIPGLNSKQKQKQYLEEKTIGNKNYKKLFHLHKSKQFYHSQFWRKSANIAYVAKLMAVNGGENVIYSQNITLIPQQSAADMYSNRWYGENKGIGNGVNLIYFESQGGQLISILQFTIKHTLTSTIKQQKIQKCNIFWSPILFNVQQLSSSVTIPMISNIQVPGYPIQWNYLNRNNKDIFCQLSYKVINDNPQLQRSSKRERQKTYRGMANVGNKIIIQLDEQKKKNYLDLLIQQMAQKDQEKIGKNVNKNKQIKNYKENNIINQKQVSAMGKQQQMEQYIHTLIKKLQPFQKSRLKPTKINQPIQKLIPQTKQKLKQQSILLAGKSYSIKLRLRQYLPLTDNYQQYYIPRKMDIKLYGFRTIYKQYAEINKDIVKCGIPIQLQNPQKLSYQGFYFIFHIDNISEDQITNYKEGNNLIVSIYDVENMLYYASGEYPSINLFQGINRKQSNIGSKLNNKDTNQNIIHYQYFRIQLKSKLIKNKCDIRGYLLFESELSEKAQIKQNQVPIVSKQLPISKQLKQMSTKQRQMLRIQNLQIKQQMNQIKKQLVVKYKKNNSITCANQIGNQEFNYHLQLDFQIGKIVYGCLGINNTDKSDNNVFSFFLDCDFIELVTDKSIYQQQSQIGNYSQRNVPVLTYIPGKQGNKAYYQCKIPSGTSCQILVKVLNNEWFANMNEVTIANIEVKRNTLSFKTYKIKLKLKKPLIDKVYHIYAMYIINMRQLKLKIPDEIILQYGDNIQTLSPYTIYHNDSGMIQLSKIGQEWGNDCGFVVEVLMGVYRDRSFKMVGKIVLVEVECLQGEYLNVNLGDLERIKIPIINQNIQVIDRIYRIQTSNDKYQAFAGMIKKLGYCSLQYQSQPQFLFKSLQVIDDELIINVINLQGRLIKKYLLQFVSIIPDGCYVEEIEVQGKIGQKIMFILVNPFYVQYWFYLCSSSRNIMFMEMQRYKGMGENEKIFKIKERSEVRMRAEIVGELQNEEYVVFCDYLHHVITRYKINVKNKQVNIPLKEGIGKLVSKGSKGSKGN